MHALNTDTKEANIASSAETQTGFPKQDWFSLVTRETQTEGKLTVDAMIQTVRVYSSNRNGDKAHECINMDMIKLLKDEIAFLRGELSRELRSNQKTIEVLLKQNSHYQTHQRKCDEFDPLNSFTRQPSKSMLKSANTTNIPITITKENTTLQAPPLFTIFLVRRQMLWSNHGTIIRTYYSIRIIVPWSNTQFLLQRKTLKN